MIIMPILAVLQLQSPLDHDKHTDRQINLDEKTLVKLPLGLFLKG